mgnify:CR=1 FL=1
MSRIGKMPIALPAGVVVGFANSIVKVKGAKGTLSRKCLLREAYASNSVTAQCIITVSSYSSYLPSP